MNVQVTVMPFGDSKKDRPFTVLSAIIFHQDYRELPIVDLREIKHAVRTYSYRNASMGSSLDAFQAG